MPPRVVGCVVRRVTLAIPGRLGLITGIALHGEEESERCARTKGNERYEAAKADDQRRRCAKCRRQQRLASS
jgi:hypothetical protein